MYHKACWGVYDKTKDLRSFLGKQSPDICVDGLYGAYNCLGHVRQVSSRYKLLKSREIPRSSVLNIQIKSNRPLYLRTYLDSV